MRRKALRPGRCPPASCGICTASRRSRAMRRFTASSPIRCGTRFRRWSTTGPFRRGGSMRCICRSWCIPCNSRIFSSWRPSCRWPGSASPFRISRRSSATSITWIRWPGASARSIPSGARPENGAAPIRMRPVSPDLWRNACASPRLRPWWWAMEARRAEPRTPWPRRASSWPSPDATSIACACWRGPLAPSCSRANRPPRGPSMCWSMLPRSACCRASTSASSAGAFRRS